MQEQNLEEWKEKIDRSAEQITVPDTLTPGAVQQMLEERKNRTSAGRKERTQTLPEICRNCCGSCGAGDCGRNLWME